MQLTLRQMALAMDALDARIEDFEFWLGEGLHADDPETTAQQERDIEAMKLLSNELGREYGRLDGPDGVIPVCDNCGSEDVKFDAWTVYYKGDHEISNVFDACYCEDCDNTMTNGPEWRESDA